MPDNRPGKFYYVLAATKAVAHGAPVIEDGVPGVAVKQGIAPFGTGPQTNVLLKRVEVGEAFGILPKGVVTVPFVASSVKGSPVYIAAADNTLSLGASGNVKFGKVVEIAGQRGCPAGFMRVDLDLKSTF